MLWFFFFFLISGFCSILYELVWLRLSMAAFGVTTALTSIVLSVFMAGLGLGSWGSGRTLQHYRGRLPIPALMLYALLELLIGISALLVPAELLWGRLLAQNLPFSSSFSYYLASGICVTAALLPWCCCMGATIPVGMLAIRSAVKSDSERTFSYLYLANVSGALLGTVVPLLLIELRGFHGTLRVGAVLNVLLALSATLLAWRCRGRTSEPPPAQEVSRRVKKRDVTARRNILILLFSTGLTSMGMEVVWIRLFTPYVGTVVYAFAVILAVYLLATTVGAKLYRAWSRKNASLQKSGWVWALLGLCGLLPLLTTNTALPWWPVPLSVYPELSLPPILRVIFGVAPFSAVAGFLTPMLVDRWAGADSELAGKAYAINVLGCIGGPLISGFLLLPLLPERFALSLFVLPWLWLGVRPARMPGEKGSAGRTVWSYAMALAALILVATSSAYEDNYPRRRVLRDDTATVIAADAEEGKRLLVNGVGMTSLSPITKIMAHLPLASLDRPPKNALVICFGMGTTFRSLLSWDIPVTAVELVPSVPRLFGFFHSDGPLLLQSPHAHVVIDDGRRYLERTTEQYDVIAVDPPPPVEAVGSSLLYTKEFYAAIRRKLWPGGIVQQWFPDEKNKRVLASATKALRESFPYVRAFPSLEGWGVHFLASDRPLRRRSPQELVAHMPSQALHDLMEWGPHTNPVAQFAVSVDKELSVESLIAAVPQIPTLEDDRPVNEYYLLHQWQRQFAATGQVGATAVGPGIRGN